MTSFYVSVPKLRRSLTRVLLQLWEGQDQHVQVLAFLILRQITLLSPHPSLHTTLKVPSLHHLITHHSSPLSVEIVPDFCAKCQIYVSHFTSEDFLHEELRGGDDSTGCCHWLPAWLCLYPAAGSSPSTGHHLRQEGGPASQTPSKVLSIASFLFLCRLCGAGSMYTVWTCGVKPSPPSSPPPPSPPSSTP